MGLIVATLQIQFNDILDLTGVFLMLVAYLTPTFYPLTIIPAHYRHLFYINPMYSFLIVFRYLEYGAGGLSVAAVAITVGSGVLVLAMGLALFVRRWPRLAARL